MEKNNNKQNKIIITIVISCLLIVASVSMYAIGFLRSAGLQEQKNDFSSSQSNILQKEVEAVKAEENLASSETGSSNKTVLKIVEVVPNSSCSVFPYFIEWGDEKGYNENLKKIGEYEGITGYDVAKELAKKFNGEACSPYTILKNAIKGKQTLDKKDYAKVNTGLFEWRQEPVKYKASEEGSTSEEDNTTEEGSTSEKNNESKDGLTKTEGVNGYFEFVGSGKGLYHINFSFVDADTTDEKAKGVRYKLDVMEREGTESPKGDWNVYKPEYYWAGNAGDAYPTSNMMSTGKNYDIKFFCAESTSNNKENSRNYLPQNVVKNGGEYQVAAFDTWNGGYEYQKNGNYKVESCRVITDLVGESNLSNYYVRVSDESKSDNTSGATAGYFRPYDKDKDAEVQAVYDIDFKHVDAGKGSYVLNTASVMTSWNTLGRAEFCKQFYFEYIGEDAEENMLGNYDVTFGYVNSWDYTFYEVKRYSCELLRVTDGKGKYALTTYINWNNQLYENVGSGQGDYSQTVTKIDFAGIDYGVGKDDKVEDGKGFYNESDPGLTMGCDKNGGENGDWVFHAVPNNEKNGYTAIAGNILESVDTEGIVDRVDLSDGIKKLKFGNRIYVYGQNFFNRGYSNDELVNNEWFKLLMYMSNEAGTGALAADDYASGTMTAYEIKEKYSDEIDAFDDMYSIEVVQKEPKDLLVEDVEGATLLYFSTQPVYSVFNDWNSFNYYTDDLRPDVLFAIYKHCMYDKTTALIYCVDTDGSKDEGFNGGLALKKPGGYENLCSGDGTYTAESNLFKMMMMNNLFDDPSRFSCFIDKYAEKEPEYSTIDQTDASVTVYKWGTGWYDNEVYNLGEKTRQSSVIPKKDGPYKKDIWERAHFGVLDVEWTGTHYNKTGDFYYGYNGEYSFYTGHFAGKDVDDTSTWYVVLSIFNIFRSGNDLNINNIANIWQIIHNKKGGKTTIPAVVVTNADGDNISTGSSAEPIYYFYVDPYSAVDPADFTVNFEVFWTPKDVKPPTPLKSVVITRVGEPETKIYSAPSPLNYKEYSFNMANDFIIKGEFDRTIKSKDYKITATDNNNKSDSVTVRFIVREAFMLN